MRPNSSRSTSLAFLGWCVKGPELVVLARMTSRVEGRGWQQHGPVLTLAVPTDYLLQDDVSKAANDAHYERERKEAAVQRMLDDARQARLFEI